MISLVLWAFVGGALLLPSWSDRVGLRRPIFAPGMVLAGFMVFASSLATGSVLVVPVMVLGASAPTMRRDSRAMSNLPRSQWEFVDPALE